MTVSVAFAFVMAQRHLSTNQVKGFIAPGVKRKSEAVAANNRDGIQSVTNLLLACCHGARKLPQPCPRARWIASIDSPSGRPFGGHGW